MCLPTACNCLFPRRNSSVYNFFFFYFLTLFLFCCCCCCGCLVIASRRSQRAKLRSVLHYFQRLNERPPEGHVTFARQVRDNTETQSQLISISLSLSLSRENLEILFKTPPPPPPDVSYCLFMMIWQIWYRSHSLYIFIALFPSLSRV